MKAKKLTIIEIAELSGVSVSTVSRVLNDHPAVSEKTRKKINKIIEEHGYTPSMFARGMINKSSKIFAVVVPDITNPYFISLISEIERLIHDFGYSLMLMNTMTAGPRRRSNSVKVEVDTFATIESKQVDGVIILGGEIDLVSPSQTYITALNRMSSKIPTVCIGQRVENANCFFIERDLFKGVTLLAMHLLSLGHKNIAFIGGEEGVTIFEQRKKTYIETLKMYVPDFEPVIIASDFYAEDGYYAGNRLIRDFPEIDASIAINDVVAGGIVRAYMDNKKNVPEDLAIVSCDMFMNHSYNTPRITTINQHNDYLGMIAVRYLISTIEGTQFENISQHSPELVIGETCGAKQ